MRVAGKEIKDECQYCGEILQCELFRQGHGINQRRENISKIVLCQLNHKDKRKKIEKEQKSD